MTTDDRAKRLKAIAKKYRESTDEQRPGALKAAAVTANAIIKAVASQSTEKHLRLGDIKIRPERLRVLRLTVNPHQQNTSHRHAQACINTRCVADQRTPAGPKLVGPDHRN